MTKVEKEALVKETLEAGGSFGDLQAKGIPKATAHRIATRLGLTNGGAPKRNGTERKGRAERNGRSARQPTISHEAGTHWTEKEKAEVLAVYVETGSIIKTSRSTNVPARTLYRWLDEDPRWREAAGEVSRVCARMLEDRADRIQLNLIRMAEGDDGKDAAAAMRGIETLHKTLSFIRGGPTDRTETNLSLKEWLNSKPDDLPL